MKEIEKRHRVAGKESGTNRKELKKRKERNEQMGHWGGGQIN